MEQAPTCWTETDSGKPSAVETALRRWINKTVVVQPFDRGTLVSASGDIAMVQLGGRYECFRAVLVGSCKSSFQLFKL